MSQLSFSSLEYRHKKKRTFGGLVRYCYDN